MRLGTCIALEIAVGLTALAATSVGSAWAIDSLRGYSSARDRAQTSAVRSHVEAPVRGRSARAAAATHPHAPAVARTGATPSASAAIPPPGAPRGAGETAGGANATGVDGVHGAAGSGVEGADVAAATAGAGATPPGPVPAGASLTTGTAPATGEHAAIEPAAAGRTGDAPGAVWQFAGQADDPLLAPLRVGTLTRVRFNRGGSSLSLRLDFDNGSRAAFKPEQIHRHSNPRREIAAYRVDRLLGIGRVPPAIGRTFELDDLIASVDKRQAWATQRLRTEAIAHHGTVRGELSWWIPVLSDVYIGKARLDETDAIIQWRRWLRAGAEVPLDRVDLCRQLSIMTVFDFLIDNTDRWTGNNARVSEDGTVLYFMDNTLSFSRNARGHRKSHIYLERVQTFSRELIDRLRRLERAHVVAVLEAESTPFEPLLTTAEIDALMGRRDQILTYVDKLIATHGEERVLVFR